MAHRFRGGPSLIKIKMKSGFYFRTTYDPFCKCIDEKHFVTLPVDNATITKECLRCEPNYDRALFYEEAVIPCFRNYKNEITRARAYIFWALRPMVSRDIARKIAQLYRAKPYDGWTTEDYQTWRKATGRIPAATKPKQRQKKIVKTNNSITGIMFLVYLLFFMLFIIMS